MSQSSKISQRALLLAAASTLGLIAAIPAQAQAPAVPGPRTETEFTPGKRVDHSRTLRHPMAPNVEREGVEFDSLGPSALTRDERAVVAQPALAPVVELRELLDGTNFESGRDVLLPKARQTLDALAARLRGQSDLRFEIVGHTDNQRISQRLKAVFPDNQALSEARARAVAAYLAGQLGLPMDAFAVVGRGETQPVATNDTPQGMAQNRRTEIRVSYRQVSEAPQPAPAPVVSLVTQDYCAPGVSARQPVSISFDGAPVEGDTSQVEADRQRCVEDLAGGDGQGHVLQDRGRADGQGQVADVQHAHGQRSRLTRGSNRSRRPSPVRLRPSTVTKMARPGMIASHGAKPIMVWASASIRPQLGAGGWAPRPT